MKNISIIFLLFVSLSSSLSAKILLSPIDAMKENYSQDADISKENLVLSATEFKKIQKEAKTKLPTRRYTLYRAKEDKKILGYGILINKKVRSKNAVVLYLIANNTLKGIEIIAFNEPHEYLPNKTWQSQFKNIKTDKMLHLSRDIPTITGATLSARSVTEGSRIAFAIYNELVQGK
jgi:Na+-translocating ferredoxin:NAD+ oxidoreductase RnfG subunit